MATDIQNTKKIDWTAFSKQMQKITHAANLHAHKAVKAAKEIHIR